MGGTDVIASVKVLVFNIGVLNEKCIVLCVLFDDLCVCRLKLGGRVQIKERSPFLLIAVQPLNQHSR